MYSIQKALILSQTSLLLHCQFKNYTQKVGTNATIMPMRGANKNNNRAER